MFLYSTLRYLPITSTKVHSTACRYSDPLVVEHSFPQQGEMGLRESTKDAVWKV